MSTKYSIHLLLIIVIAVWYVSGCSKEQPASEPAPAPPVSSPQTPTAPEPEKPKQVKPPQPKPAPQVQEEEPQPKIGFTQKFVALNWMDNGKLRMKAKSRQFDGDEITKKGTFTNFSAELYENGKLTATLKAPKAVVDGDKRTVVASGGVTMKSMERKTSLVAPSVVWYANKKKVVGSGGVKIDSENGQITAAEIETDTTLSKISVRGSR